MSTRRFRKTYSTKQAVGANGKPACLECSGDITKPRRRTFCDAPCAHNFRMKTSSSYVRNQVYRRDRGVCALCKANTMVGIPRPRASGSGSRWQADHIRPVVEGGGECGLENYRTLCTSCHRRVTAELRARLAAARNKIKTKARTKLRETA